MDHEASTIVLSCRGSLGLSDILVDLTCSYESIHVPDGDPMEHYYVHSGELKLISALVHRSSPTRQECGTRRLGCSEERCTRPSDRRSYSILPTASSSAVTGELLVHLFAPMCFAHSLSIAVSAEGSQRACDFRIELKLQLIQISVQTALHHLGMPNFDLRA